MSINRWEFTDWRGLACGATVARVEYVRNQTAPLVEHSDQLKPKRGEQRRFTT